MKLILAALAALAALSAAGCTGDVGTIGVRLVYSPGSAPLATATLGRLRLSSPETVVETRLDEPSPLTIDIEARDTLATLTFEAEDASGNLVATGRTPALPLTGIDFDLSIFVAPPWSVTEAPISFAEARTGVASARLAFGAALIGGIDDTGAAVTELLIYNSYRHEFQDGQPLPEGRGHAAAISNTRGLIYIFGGSNSDGVDQATSWRFDTGVPPAGAYLTLDSDASLARRDHELLPLGQEQFLGTGTPLALIDGFQGTVSELEGGQTIGGRGAAFAFPNDLIPTVLLLGAESGPGFATLVRDGEISPQEAPSSASRSRHSMLNLGSDVLAIGGQSDDGTPLGSAVVFHVADQMFTSAESFLSSARYDVGVAATAEYFVVAGGTEADGSASSLVEIFDTSTLAPISTTTMTVPRVSPTLVVLDNDQILIAGGTNAAGVPYRTIELVTPGPQ